MSSRCSSPLRAQGPPLRANDLRLPVPSRSEQQPDAGQQSVPTQRNSSRAVFARLMRRARLPSFLAPALPPPTGRSQARRFGDDYEPVAPRHDRGSAVHELAQILSETHHAKALHETAAQVVVDNLAMFEAVTDSECAICFETASSGEGNWRQLPCGHPFHEDCLLTMLKCSHRHACPLCRMEIPAALRC